MKVRVFDIEADNLLHDVTTIHCGVFSSLDGKEVDTFTSDRFEDMRRYMDSCDVLIAHNCIQYDFPVMKKLWGYEYKGKKVDTVLMSRLQNPHRRVPINGMKDPDAVKAPHGLAAWGYRVGIEKPKIEEWMNMNDEILVRCQTDVKINVATYHELRKEAEGQNWRSAHLLTFKLWENLARQEEAGWLIDQAYMHRSIRLLDHWLRKIMSVLQGRLPLTYDVCEGKDRVADGGAYRWVKEPFLKSGAYKEQVIRHFDERDVYARNIVGPFSRIRYRKISLTSDSEAKAWMLSQGWEPAEWNLDDDGNPRSPKMPKDGEFPGVEGRDGKLYSKYAKACHRKSNIEGWLRRVREDGRLESCVTGLADTRRAKHGNIANVPNAEAFFGKQMRKGFIAREGWALVSADAASCQDRMMANRAGDAAFTKMLLEGSKEDGTDSHTLAKVGINGVLDRFRLNPISRGKAKNFNFGWTFGASDNKLGKMCGGSKEVGSQIREALRQVFPAKAALIDKITAEWRQNAKRRMNRWNKMEYYDGWIAGLDGAPIFIKSEHAVLVYAVQSDEAVYMSAVYNLIHRYLDKEYEWGKDFVVVCYYHDEISVECQEVIAEDVAKIMEKAFDDASKYFKLTVPQVGEAKIGKTWLEVH